MEPNSYQHQSGQDSSDSEIEIAGPSSAGVFNSEQSWSRSYPMQPKSSLSSKSEVGSKSDKNQISPTSSMSKANVPGDSGESNEMDVELITSATDNKPGTSSVNMKTNIFKEVIPTCGPAKESGSSACPATDIHPGTSSLDSATPSSSCTGTLLPPLFPPKQSDGKSVSLSLNLNIRRDVDNIFKQTPSGRGDIKRKGSYKSLSKTKKKKAKEEKPARESDPKRLTMDKKTLPNALD